MQVVLIDEQEKCGFDKYMERIDGMFSHWDNFGGALASATTDIVYYYAASPANEPPVIKAW